jgi:hypothetical protein
VKTKAKTRFTIVKPDNTPAVSAECNNISNVRHGTTETKIISFPSLTGNSNVTDDDRPAA